MLSFTLRCYRWVALAPPVFAVSLAEPVPPLISDMSPSFSERLCSFRPQRQHMRLLPRAPTHTAPKSAQGFRDVLLIDHGDRGHLAVRCAGVSHGHACVIPCRLHPSFTKTTAEPTPCSPNTIRKPRRQAESYEVPPFNKQTLCPTDNVLPRWEGTYGRSLTRPYFGDNQTGKFVAAAMPPEWPS